jgi:hypothetical protein
LCVVSSQKSRSRESLIYWLTIAAIGVALADIPIVEGEADFVFATEGDGQSRLVATEESLRAFAASASGDLETVETESPTNRAICDLIDKRFTSDHVIGLVGEIEISLEVIGAVLQITVNCGGRLVFAEGGTVAVAA